MTRRSSPPPTIRTPGPEVLADWGQGVRARLPAFTTKYAGMSSVAAHLAQKLTQQLPIKDESVLRTVAEAANYALALPRA